MGIDMEMWARFAEPVGDETIAELNLAFRAEFAPDGERWPDLARCTYERDDRTLHVVSTDRFYGPAYPRGHWPKIRAMGDWLAVRIGETGEVRYGADVTLPLWDDLQPWAEVRVENETHWVDAGGEEAWRHR